MEEQDASKVSSVVRTMSILETLAERSPLGITEIGRATSIHKSTVFRFLATLCSLGYVYRLPDSDLYALTVKMGIFTNNPRDEKLLALSLPYLDNLSRSTLETVHLAVLLDDKLRYLHKIESTQSLRVVTASHTGGGGPLYCTGLGKVMLAWMDDAKRSSLLERVEFKRFTPTTITDTASLLKELERIRAAGYAIDNGEHEEGIVCIAAPIRKGGTDPIAAISIAGPAPRMEKNMEEYTSEVLAQTRAIESLIP